MDLSIIIVNYNTKELLKQTIQSVIDTTKNIDYEIIVSDNNSTDGSIEMVEEYFPQVNLIKNKDNLGFPKGNNVAIKKSIGRYVLLLNSDTVVIDNCLEKCIKYMNSHKNIGVLGCRVVLKDGQLDHACKRGFPTPESSLFYMLKLYKLFPDSKKFGQYTLSYLHEDEINEVDSLTGAFMMLRKETIDEVGLLDEEFFMYGEDIDWCYRIKEAGWKVMYYPEAKIIHYKGASSKKKRFKTLYEFHRAMILFYDKHYRLKYNIFVTILVYLGVCVKFILSLFVNIFKKRG
ncbi:glycosyltransferase family 2 protein [Clostridium aciditolerans]|uniref:Glycosyltransferase family 2 protein n=1 Tax=Clostridium aciditolerans TaxID=339861 RepID=A0A934HUK9_9CLOT|nr:glycosyltransferase family 2 protein [Clostridium aciditolerans]MBI6873603.1 glycosyltransferase family 2 protein [Clostridium aciditolerans]